MNDDAVLLQRYADDGSESAFTELVRRHADLVYGAALRRTNGDSHRAADVAQEVFTTLARQARKLTRHTVLPAWLHTATRNAAINVMISEQRRHAREQEACALDPEIVARGASLDWDGLRPTLDGAIDELPEPDRAAVVLRFLESRAYAEIGRALRVSEDAARVRTDRALEKLRTILARHGITSTAAALGVIVSTQSVGAAPAGLALTLASNSLAAASVGTGLLTTAIASFMSTKIITTAAVSAILAFWIGSQFQAGRTVVAAAPSAPAPAPIAAPREDPMLALLSQENATLRAEIQNLKTEFEKIDTLNDQLIAERAARAAAPKPKSVTLGMSPSQQQRAMLNNLRQIASARDQYIKEYARPAASIHDLVGVGAYIKTVRTVGGEDYASLPMDKNAPLTVITPDGLSVTYDPAGGTTTTVFEMTPAERQAEEFSRRIGPSVDKAVQAYQAANGGEGPKDEQALMPYFSSPQELEGFKEAIKLRKAAEM